ncbi:MFS transporter [Streptomyces sp. NPDC059766]|uniref:MFS transporter n=1 Tax=Streptomyces sp. NPDC059766 TaxID=3346940 RepID=UPI00365B1D24
MTDQQTAPTTTLPAGPSAVAGTPRTGHPAPAPARHRWAALAVVCVGTMMAFVNVSSTIGALSSIQTDLGADATEIVWITSAYSLLVATLILAAGTLADRIGRRLVFTAGAVFFLAGSLAAFTAGSAGVLIAAQAVMGIGGAMVLPAGLAVVTHLFVTPKERTEAVSIWAGSSGLGLALGPLGSGFLLQAYSWHAVFLINVALAVVTVAGAARLVPESRHPQRRLDPVGIALATLAIGSLTFGIIEGKSLGYTSPVILGSYATAAAAAIVFARYEARHRDPMMDVRLFASGSFSAVMGVATLTMFGFTGTALLTVLYLQHSQDLTALGASVRILAMFVPFIVISPLAAKLVHRIGFKFLLALGAVIMSGGIFLLLTTLPEPDFSHLWPGLAAVGIGSGLLVAPSTAAALTSVDQHKAGMASSAVNMFRQLGNVLGASILGTILTSQFTSNLTDRLTGAGLPADTTDRIVNGAEHGSRTGTLPDGIAGLVHNAVHHAFTDAYHTALLVAAVAVAAVTVPTLLFVRHRPAA